MPGPGQLQANLAVFIISPIFTWGQEISTSGYQYVALEPAALALPGMQQKGKLLGPDPDLLDQKLWGRGPALWGLMSPPVDSDGHSSLRATGLTLVLLPCILSA